jgi:anti-sigma factor RsiW
MSDYLAGLLDEGEEQAVEEHLFSCISCARDAEPLFGLAAAIPKAAAPVLTAERFRTLDREGRVAQVNVMAPGQVSEVRYPEAGKLLVHRLGGSDLRGAERVDVEIVDLEGNPAARLDDVPFDAASGEVFLACQRHFSESFPRDALFRLEVVRGERREEASRYTILHRL